MESVKEEEEHGTILKKKTQGRRKIEIRKIEKRSSRQATFSKRRAGLFKYVNDVCVLTGAQIGVIVKSPANRVFACGSPNIDAIIDRFQKKSTDPSPEIFWWQESVESLGLQELQEFVAALEELKNNVSRKIMMTEEGFQSIMVTPEFEEAVSMVDGWLNFTGKDRDFSDDCAPGSENLNDSSSRFENVHSSSSGFQSIMVTPEFEEAVSMVDGWLNFTGKDRDFSDDCVPGSENLDDSSSGFENGDSSSSGFQKFDDTSSGFENVDDSSSGFQKIDDSSFGFHNFDDFSHGFENFDESFSGFDDFSSVFQDFDGSSYGFERFDEHSQSFQKFGFPCGQAGSPLLLNY